MTIRKTALTIGALLLLSTAALQVSAQENAQLAQLQAAQAERAKAQDAIEAKTKKLQITEEILPLRIPGHTLGETEGVSKNAAGHLFVYSRTGRGGSAKAGAAAQLFEFDQNYQFVKHWAQNAYGTAFAHAVRIDKDQNVWVVDKGSSMVMQFDKDENIVKVLGRKPEAIDWLEEFLERGEKDTTRFPVGNVGTFYFPTDIAWSPNGDNFISDGYGNSRVVKIAKDGTWVKSVGTRGSGPLQFSTPHSIDVDPDGNVYVADRGNFRIQIYDYDLNHKEDITGIGAPWSVRWTPKYIYSGDGTGKIYQIDRKTHKLLGWAQTSMGSGQNGCLIHSLYPEGDNVLYKGSCTEWNIRKITIK